MSKAAPVSRAGNSTGNKRATPPAKVPEVVDPRWLLKAFGVMVLVALVCGYLTLCWLFSRGQWQLVLHPSRTTAIPSNIDGISFEPVRFGAAGTGVPQLTGWWIPAEPGADYRHLTILYLPGGQGSLAGDQAALKELHSVGTSIFAIDYRGYGQSADIHPSEHSMAEDTRAAWNYLTGSRGLPGSRIIPYGKGLGAALALDLTRNQDLVPAVILDNPDFHVMDSVRKDHRAYLLPVGLLFHDRFDLRPALDQIHKPKLIVTRAEKENPASLLAADPKTTVALPPSSTNAEYVHAMHRFLDLYAPPSPMPRMVPTPAR